MDESASEHDDTESVKANRAAAKFDLARLTGTLGRGRGCRTCPRRRTLAGRRRPQRCRPHAQCRLYDGRRCGSGRLYPRGREAKGISKARTDWADDRDGAHRGCRARGSPGQTRCARAAGPDEKTHQVSAANLQPSTTESAPLRSSGCAGSSAGRRLRALLQGQQPIQPSDEAGRRAAALPRASAADAPPRAVMMTDCQASSSLIRQTSRPGFTSQPLVARQRYQLDASSLACRPRLGERMRRRASQCDEIECQLAVGHTRRKAGASRSQVSLQSSTACAIELAGRHAAVRPSSAMTLR
jgi:hypothetical protein